MIVCILLVSYSSNHVIVISDHVIMNTPFAYLLPSDSLTYHYKGYALWKELQLELDHQVNENATHTYQKRMKCIHPGLHIKILYKRKQSCGSLVSRPTLERIYIANLCMHENHYTASTGVVRAKEKSS